MLRSKRIYLQLASQRYAAVIYFYYFGICLWKYLLLGWILVKLWFFGSLCIHSSISFRLLSFFRWCLFLLIFGHTLQTKLTWRMLINLFKQNLMDLRHGVPLFWQQCLRNFVFAMKPVLALKLGLRNSSSNNSITTLLLTQFF